MSVQHTEALLDEIDEMVYDLNSFFPVPVLSLLVMDLSMFLFNEGCC